MKKTISKEELMKKYDEMRENLYRDYEYVVQKNFVTYIAVSLRKEGTFVGPRGVAWNGKIIVGIWGLNGVRAKDLEIEISAKDAEEAMNQFEEGIQKKGYVIPTGAPSKTIPSYDMQEALKVLERCIDTIDG